MLHLLSVIAAAYTAAALWIFNLHVNRKGRLSSHLARVHAWHCYLEVRLV
jgi:hypothetical protein